MSFILLQLANEDFFVIFLAEGPQGLYHYWVNTMSPQLAGMFHLLSEREVSLCHLEKAPGWDWQLRPDISISKRNLVEMFNLLEVFRSEYLKSLSWNLGCLLWMKKSQISLSFSFGLKNMHIFMISCADKHVGTFDSQIMLTQSV